MARLSLKGVEERVAPLAGRESYDRDFIFDLLLAYGKPQGNVTRLRNGSLNVAADPFTEVAQKNVVYFKTTTSDPLAVLEDLKTSPAVVRYNTRFVIATDFVELVATDTKTGDTIGFPIREIDQHFTYFLPWAGMEKTQYVSEAHADVKAAERMGKLFDELLSASPGLLGQSRGRHALNLFFTRLLFCYFAEDTEIFEENQFTNAVASHTQVDGSDTAEFLAALFEALDTASPADKPSHLAAFPYVNGRLFKMADDHVVPTFTKAARQELINAGKLIWREINPDIFGSMFQAIVNPAERSDLGQHYTSVPNILKTIEPLFLNGLKDELDAGFDSAKRLEALLKRISAIRVFDPACGSGNFLVIAYKELRRLEHAILERLGDIDYKHRVLFDESRISIENFYGIEIDDFAVEVAILSLWIAKHQMNVEFKEKFGPTIPLIPLKEAGQIFRGNALAMHWAEVCPNNGHDEIYVIGNPPYLGSRNQSPEHKRDLARITSRFRSLDYVAGWVLVGAEYIRGTAAQLALVTTNSITQGEQVALLWPIVLGNTLEIGYAYTSFAWSNRARGGAGVTCVVFALRSASKLPKHIYTDEIRHEAERINAYLAEGPDVWLGRRSSPISASLPRVGYGSMPNDGGHLILSDAEKDRLLVDFPEAVKWIRGFCGADEFIKGKTRWCLTIPDEDLLWARSIPDISARLDGVRRHRLSSTEKSTNALAAHPNRFYFFAHRDSESLIIPSISSERREYVPIGYVDAGTVGSNKALVMHDTSYWALALVTSRMHMSWMRSVSGRLESSYQYSNTIVYNNFPVPHLSEAVKEQLTVAALRVLDVREYHCERTLAELYDPDKMPDDLRRAHGEVDALVDSIYSKRPYETDDQRLSDLFAMYERMSAEEAAKIPARKTRSTKL
jgi:hypothetical protein